MKRHLQQKYAGYRTLCHTAQPARHEIMCTVLLQFTIHQFITVTEFVTAADYSMVTDHIAVQLTRWCNRNTLETVHGLKDINISRDNMHTVNLDI